VPGEPGGAGATLKRYKLGGNDYFTDDNTREI
jgi:hypothetical protein